MEFKITKDKIVQWNKMLLCLNKINKIYSPCLVSVVHLAHFIIFEGFWGVLRCLLQLSIQKTCTARPFSSRNSNSNPLQCKGGLFISLHLWLACKYLPRYCSSSNDYCFTTGAFNFLPHLVTILSTTVWLEINISHRFSVTTATYQTGAQSKLSLKRYHSLPTTPRKHFDASL